MENAWKVAIRTALARHGKTFAWLASRIGVSRPTVTNHLAGEAVSGEFLRRVAKALGVGRKQLDTLALEEYELARAEGRAVSRPKLRPQRP
jgi:predicted transcriptional regulator